MNKVKEYIKKYTRRCSNEIVSSDSTPEYSPWLTPYHGECIAQIAIEEFTDNLWHDPDEVPRLDSKILWEYENFLGKYLGGEWKPKIDVFGRKERWCYLADILPHSKTTNRPYSAVDHSEGYEEGYQAAVTKAIEWLKKNVTYVHPRKKTEECIINLTKFQEDILEDG